MIDERSYLYNPFRITEATEEQIINTYANIQNSLIPDAETGADIANNIVRYANMNYIVGEMLARYKTEYNKLKTNITIRENKELYKARKEWAEQNTDKPPAMSYFEAKAKESVQQDLIKLAEMDAYIDRFKNTYNSITEKQNALKKKLEILRYEL